MEVCLHDWGEASPTVISLRTCLHCHCGDGFDTLHGRRDRRLECRTNDCREVYDGPTPTTQANTAAAAATRARASSAVGASGSAATTSSYRENPTKSLALSRVSLSIFSSNVSRGSTAAAVASSLTIFLTCNRAGKPPILQMSPPLMLTPPLSGVLDCRSARGGVNPKLWSSGWDVLGLGTLPILNRILPRRFQSLAKRRIGLGDIL